MADSTGRPVYRRIADDLRGGILQGTLPEGTRLPSESELMHAYGVARATARQALGVIRAEGLIESHKGRGSFVRGARPLCRLAGDRYARGTDVPSPYEGRTRRRAHWEIGWERVPASPAVARRLAVPEGVHVVATRYLYVLGDTPVQLATSYHLPSEHDFRSDLDELAPAPSVGTVGGALGALVARLAETGQTLADTVEEVVEEVSCRAPRPDEVDALRIEPGVHVLAITRTIQAAGAAVETCDIVVPGDRCVLSYRLRPRALSP